MSLITALYKPYRMTKEGRATIIESTEDKFVVKPKAQIDEKALFAYLNSRGFTGYPSVVDDSRSEFTIYEHIEDAKCPAEQKAIDLIRLLTDLHGKTSFTKEVREDKYKEIYETIMSNLNYYEDKYARMREAIEEEVFMSPSHYLFIRSSSKLFSMIVFCKSKLDDWYELVKNKGLTRVSLVHNNIDLSHYLRGNKEALISWEKASLDSPILDFYNFYTKEALNLEFASILKEYLKRENLEEDERQLLFILMCMPRDIEEATSEFQSCEKISLLYDYIYRTEWLMRPYYTPDDEEEEA